MYWLSRPPIGRWAAAIAIAALAVWIEARPEPSVPHPFATRDISPGEVLDSTNTRMRDVPSGILEPPGDGAVARRPIQEGDPLLAGDGIDEADLVPPGWWVLQVEVPPGSRPGDPVRVVLLDSGAVVEGVVAAATSDDPFAPGGGGAIAVAPGDSTEVALAASDRRLAVLVSSG